MIKPATLWGLFKTCDDELWLGRICRALGGQEVSLDYGQKQMVKAIMLDSGWMDERVEAQREKWREQKRNKKGKYDNKENAESSAHSSISTEENAENAESSSFREIPPPSVRPSVRPSVQKNKEDKLLSPKPPKGADDGVEPLGVRSKGSDEFEHVDREYVHYYFVRMRSNGKPASESSEAIEEEFWQFLIEVDFKKNDGYPIQKHNVHSTYAAWVNRRRKEARDSAAEAKAAADKQAEEERLEEIRQRRLLDENGRDD